MSKRWPVVLCGIIVLAVTALQHANVPLYDGVALPDEPYRYVNAPVGKGTKKSPTSPTGNGLISDGYNKDGIYLNSDEQGPQIFVSFTQHCFQTTAQTTTIDVAVKALAPDASVPPSGMVAGNVYRVTASSDNGAVKYVANKTSPSYVDMRLPQGYPAGAVMVFRRVGGSTWQALPTSQVGSDIYEGKVVSLGDYALTSKIKPAVPLSAKLQSILPWIIPLITLLAIVLFIRRASRKQGRSSE